MNLLTIDRPFEDVLADCASLLERMDHLLWDLEPLTPDEARRATSPRHAADAVIAEIAAICADLEIAHAGPVAVDDMQASRAHALRLRHLVERVDLVRAKLHAARAEAEARSWRTALTFYALLKGLCLHDPSMKARLQSLRTFFGHGRRRASTS
jgi:hypothetical protein